MKITTDVKISDNSTARQGYTISNAFSYGIQAQIQKLISYLDTDKKIVDWESVLETGVEGSCKKFRLYGK